MNVEPKALRDPSRCIVAFKNRANGQIRRSIIKVGNSAPRQPSTQIFSIRSASSSVTIGLYTMEHRKVIKQISNVDPFNKTYPRSMCIVEPVACLHLGDPEKWMREQVTLYMRKDVK